MQLDAEGYVIRPTDTDSVGKVSKDSFSSDSGSDSGEEKKQNLFTEASCKNVLPCRIFLKLTCCFSNILEKLKKSVP